MSKQPEVEQVPAHAQDQLGKENYKNPEAFAKLMDDYFATIDKDKNKSISRKELQDVINIPDIDPNFKAAISVVEQNYKFFERLNGDQGFTRKDLAQFSKLTGENFYKDIAVKSSKSGNGMVRLGGAAVGGVFAGVVLGPEAAPIGAVAGMALVDSVRHNNLTFNNYSDLKDRNKIESMNYFDLKAK